MKYIIIILSILSVCVTSQAQDKKFSFGVSLFPNYSTGIISNDGNTAIAIQNIYSENEIGKFSLGGNVFVEYKLGEKSNIGFGLGYQNNGLGTKKLDVIYLDPITSNPTIDYQIRFIYNYHNLEIPIYFRYNFANRYYLMLGASTIFNVLNKNTLIRFEDGRVEKSKSTDNSTDFRKLNFCGDFGIGLDYLKKEKLSLFVNSYVQYGVLGISKTASLNRNILSIGISTGIRI